jgi:hypothetical protein
VLGIDELEEGVDVVSVDGCYGVVCLAEPKKDDTGDGDGGWGWGSVVEASVRGEDFLLELTHEGIRQGAAGAVSHCASVDLGVKLTQPLEMGKSEDGFQQGDDLLNRQGGALLQHWVLLEEVADCCDSWGSWDAGVHVCDIEG